MNHIKKFGRYTAVATYEYLLEYDTPKYVHVQDKFAGLFFRLVQVCVLLFVSLYLIWWKTGYQRVGHVSSVTMYKLKGVSLSESHGNFNPVSQFWDSVDYLIPVKQKDQFIIPTRYIYTPRQKYDYCPESPDYSTCESDANCTANVQVPGGNGIMNGTCDRNTSTCVIYSWCPVETNNRSASFYITNFLNFTVFVKNYISFPDFPEATPTYAHRNVRNTHDSSSDLKTCRFDPSNESLLYCPIFSLKTLLTDPAMIKNHIPMDVDNLINGGGLVDLSIHWNCNLDFSIDNCKPIYKTQRLDETNVSLSPGYNFRKADYSYEDEGRIKYRYLYKLYGIKFNIVVSGIAKRFDVYQLLITIGSGISYFALATIVTDFFILWVYRKRKLYRKEKYQPIEAEVEDPDLLTKLLDGHHQQSLEDRRS